MSRVLIVDDHQQFTEIIGRDLRRRGYEVQSAYTGAAGIAVAREYQPKLVLLDLNLSDMSGLDVLGRVKAVVPGVSVAIVTGYPELSSALAAIKGEVVDYLCKPFPSSELEAVLEKVFRAERPGRKERAAEEPTESPASAEVEMIGTSPATEALRTLVRQVASSGARTVLLTGESGTGKDLTARLLHASGRRHAAPFVELNCSAISESLFEAELFGNERGAFTGAVASRRGLVEVADGGTLFLDEVGEIPLPCQPKLLRFLEDQTFLRVGGRQKIHVDVQVIAATNRDLRTMVEQWTFRQDLYFRLHVVPIAIPPLRERTEDIVPLARYWLREANARYDKQVKGMSPDVEAAFLAHDWPGNVRELRNLVERLVILATDDSIEADDLPAEYRAAAPVTATADEPPVVTLDEIERQHIRKVLARVDGNKTRAAELLGISRQTLRTKLTQP